VEMGMEGARNEAKKREKSKEGRNEG